MTEAPTGEQDDTSSLRSQLDAGYTLPDSWYTSAQQYENEMRVVFGQSWQYAGLDIMAPAPGDFFTMDCGRVPILLVRGEDAQLRAFLNVCRHRGSILIGEEGGNRKSLQCGYHAWTYALDGHLRAAPGANQEPDFDFDLHSLKQLQIARLGPFLFVNPDINAARFEGSIGKLPQLIEQTGINLNRLRPRIRRSFEIAANWKVVVDNYLECYHCPIAHPKFCDVIDVKQYTVREYEHFSTQTAPKKSGLLLEGAPNGHVDSGFYAYLWPNFTINIYPGPGNVSVNVFVPVAPDRTVAIFDYCFVDEVSDSDATEFAAFVDQVQAEDTVLCESVQRGLASGLFGQGRLMLTQEKALRHFQRHVLDAMLTA